MSKTIENISVASEHRIMCRLLCYNTAMNIYPDPTCGRLYTRHGNLSFGSFVRLSLTHDRQPVYLVIIDLQIHFRSELIFTCNLIPGQLPMNDADE